MVESVCVKGPFTGVIFVMQLNAIFVALNCKFQSAQANQLQFQPNSNAIHPHNITRVSKVLKTWCSCVSLSHLTTKTQGEPLENVSDVL